MTQAATAVILAGGQGTRFWPISRMARPKQFLSISPSGESLIQATAHRIQPLVGARSIVVVTNHMHEAQVREHLPSAAIITEPVGKNTAPSIGLAALHLVRKDPEVVMVVLPADHAVKDEVVLRQRLAAAIELASRQELLVTIGITPSFPHTGYGYIQRGPAIGAESYRVHRFFEKPNFERAERYVQSGDYYWNSGMFVWRARTILQAFEALMPELYAALREIDSAIGTSREGAVVSEVFARIESTSIDFGVLEHARNCAVVEAGDIGWNDVGSWDAWAEHFSKDQQGNLLRGKNVAIDSQNCVVYGGERTVALVGCDDMVVIDAPDAILICPRKRVQDVKKVVDELKKRGDHGLI